MIVYFIFPMITIMAGTITAPWCQLRFPTRSLAPRFQEASPSWKARRSLRKSLWKRSPGTPKPMGSPRGNQ